MENFTVYRYRDKSSIWLCWKVLNLLKQDDTTQDKLNTPRYYTYSTNRKRPSCPLVCNAKATKTEKNREMYTKKTNLRNVRFASNDGISKV